MNTKTKNNLLWQIPFLLFLVIGTVWILGRSKEITYRTDEGRIFGTVYHITYSHDADASELIRKKLEEVNSVFSTFEEESEISKINTNSHAESISPMFREVFTLSQVVSEQTDGAFDITVAPLVNAWGFGFKNADNVTPKMIDSLRTFVGFHKVKLTSAGRIEKQDPRTMLDCSAIAKGYGTDMVARLLDSIGSANYMVEVGGEIVVKGINAKGKSWRIGINKPIDNATTGELQTMLDISGIAMATSGNYRRFYIKGNKKFAHTIDPSTGYPVSHTLLSATILAPTCAVADAYATAFMVMGMDKAKAVLDRHPELEAYFIYTDDKGELATWASPSLQDKIAR